CVTRGCLCVLNATWSAFTSIMGVFNNNKQFIKICLSYDVALLKAKNCNNGAADVECAPGDLLPGLNRSAKEVWYDYVKKLVTYGSPRVRLDILSRISRYLIAMAMLGCSDQHGYPKGEDHPSEGSKCLYAHAQESNPNKTSASAENTDTKQQPSDLTAESHLQEMRRRSSHSSPEPKGSDPRKTKGSSKKPLANKTKVSQLVSNQTLRTFVTSKLDRFKNIDGKYNGIIRILADPAYLQFCYMLIKGKPGNMRRGLIKETLDGISYLWFEETANSLLTGKFEFTPSRRVLIPKPGKTTKRPLGVGSPREKIVQKGLQIILEAMFEPKFLDCSHGFRPNRSTHSALRMLYLKGNQFSWVVQGDISACFDSIPHHIILNILKRDIICDKFLTIINKSLTAGYRDPETGKYVKSKIGSPQGSVLSPLLSNIVLHEFDKYIMEVTIPENTKGLRRKTNPEYNKLISQRYIRGNYQTPNEQTRVIALKKMREIPRMDPLDPTFRRAMYLRYADDFVILLEGNKSEAILIRQQIQQILLDKCGLELNLEKTLVTNITEKFEFLGASISKSKIVDFRMKSTTRFGKIITTRPRLRLRINMPTLKLLDKLREGGFIKRNNKCQFVAIPRTNLVNLDHATILQHFNSKVNSLINYYTFASNRVETNNLIWLLRFCLAKTLARKYKLRSARLAFKKFGPLLKDPISDLKFLLPNSLNVINQYNTTAYESPANTLTHSWHSRLTKTNLFQECLICGSSKDIQMHHLRSVKDVRS
uniref:reverse transcriptase domain-containing protein n=1 Tax=Ramaria rubella TaxID=113071 RepID=UPI0022388067